MPVDLLAMGLGVALAHAEPLPDRVSERTRPSPALLEFLGSWETADGVWVDPGELAEIKLDASPPRAETAEDTVARPDERTGERKEDDHDTDD
ncbi:MAG: hypothetical protein HZA24_06915 [Nitrospirae bacterium]|nr:hypothetical protein [Nitrospirota bacterium]